MAKSIHDEVGYWSEIKLDIIKDYAQEYTKILSKQKLSYIYIDAFAGSGIHVSKKTGEYILGSPMNALLVTPPFNEYYLIDLDQDKTDNLKELAQGRKDVFIHEGDCNKILKGSVFPKAKWENYRRALCILDPYGLHLNWDIIYTAGQMKSIEIFLNFPVADMNRNVLWGDPTKVESSQLERMNAYWGDDSWRKVAYSTEGNFLGYEEKQGNEAIAKAFQKRLKTIAGFKYVPNPIPMRNKNNAIVYYLFFASQNPTASKIVNHIFTKYKDRKGSNGT